jgi:hypothetical protein
MSLLLTYHDVKRACICSDDRKIIFNEAGEAVPLAERVPKFIVAGGLVFAALGAFRHHEQRDGVRGDDSFFCGLD